MIPVVDKTGQTIACIYQNIILDTEQEKVIGLILGNCVFGKKNAPVGKFFNDTFRKKNGKIIAKIGKASSKKPQNESVILQDAWLLLSGMREHVCMWIDEKDSWTKENFIEYLHED